jgi:hypothetical protein
MNEFDINGDQCIGQMNGGTVNHTIINGVINKFLFEFDDYGQLLKSLRYPNKRYLFKQVIIYYSFLFLLFFVISSANSMNIDKHLFLIFFILPLTLYFIYISLRHSNRLFKDRIELDNKKTIIYFKDIRKLKRQQLNVKIYHKQDLYPKHVLGLRNEDHVDLVMECFENWLENQSNKKKRMYPNK